MHTRIVISNLAPAPVIEAIPLSSPNALELAQQLGVELTNSVTLGRLAEPYRQLARGTPCALFYGSEGHVMHVPNDAVPESSPLRTQQLTPNAATIVPVGTLVPDAPGDVIALGDGKPDQREVDVLRAECDRLSIVLAERNNQLGALDAALGALDAARDQLVTEKNLALSELVALKVTHHQLAERCRLAEQDRDALAERLKVERAEQDATLAKLADALSRLDRLDRVEHEAEMGEVAPNDV